MRSVIGPVLVLAALAGCDRQSPPAPQGNAEASAEAIQPDEVTADAPAAPKSGAIDTSHAGEAAPPYPFADLSGAARTLSDFRGRPTLVNLWATWCVPCIRELPTLEALAKREAGKLNVVLLSQDSDASKVAPFLQKRSLSPAGVHTDGKMAWLPSITTTLPTTILYDSRGREVWRVVGDRDWASAASAAEIAKAR